MVQRYFFQNNFLLLFHAFVHNLNVRGDIDPFLFQKYDIFIGKVMVKWYLFFIQQII